MLTGLLLVLVGGGDLARTHLARRGAVVAVSVLWLLCAVGAVVGLGAHPLAVLLILFLAAGWILTTTTAEGRRPPGGLRPAVGLAAVLAVLVVLDPGATDASSPIARAHDQLTGPLGSLPLAQLVTGLGVALVLVETANVVVRAALYRELDQPPAPARPVRSSLLDRLRGRPVVAEVRRPDLRGGRAIGPLERLLVTGLTLSGAIALAGAVLAAKGIVRFPEISRDDENGSRAEYFLVGSLVSWSIALACAGLLVLAGG